MLGHTILLVYSGKIQLMNTYLNLAMRIAESRHFIRLVIAYQWGAENWGQYYIERSDQYFEVNSITDTLARREPFSSWLWEARLMRSSVACCWH